MQRPRAGLIRVARLVDLAQGIKGGLELAVRPAVVVELQLLLRRRRILPVGDGDSRVCLIQGRGRRPGGGNDALVPAFHRRFQRHFAALAGQDALGVAAGQLHAQGAGEQVGLIKGDCGATGAVLRQDVKPGQRVGQVLRRAGGDLRRAELDDFLPGHCQRILRQDSERIFRTFGVGNISLGTPFSEITFSAVP